MLQLSTPQKHEYLGDTMLTQRETTVLASGQNEGSSWVAVAESIFHPQGGGQPADSGWLNGVPVKPIRDHDSGLVILVPSGTEPLPDYLPGDRVSTRIDADLRLLHAALHTAGHLIEAVAHSIGWRMISVNHFPGQSRVEFESSSTDSRLSDPDGRAALAAQLQDALQAAIEEDLPVTASTTQKGHRCVQIGDIHKVPCGGTHVGTLSELRELNIAPLRVKKGRIKVSYSVAHTYTKKATSPSWSSKPMRHPTGAL